MKFKLIIASLLTVVGLQGMQSNTNIAQVLVIQKTVAHLLSSRGKVINPKKIIVNHLPLTQNDDFYTNYLNALVVAQSDRSTTTLALFVVKPNGDKFDLLRYTSNSGILNEDIKSQNDTFTNLKFENQNKNEIDICFVNAKLTREKAEKTLKRFDLVIFNQPENTPYTDPTLIVNDPVVSVQSIVNSNDLVAAKKAQKEILENSKTLADITKELATVKRDGEDPKETLQRIANAYKNTQKIFNTNPLNQPSAAPVELAKKESSFFANHYGKITIVAILAAMTLWARYMR